MNSKNTNIRGFSLVELLLVVAIVLIVLRYVYAHEIFEWESGIVRSYGIDPDVYRFITGGILMCSWVAIAIYQRMKRKRRKQTRFTSLK